MSWSISFIGKPASIIIAMDKQSELLSGQSKIEFDDAKIHINGLLSQNFGNEELIKVSASGSGYSVDGVQKNRRCVVTMEGIYGVLLPEPTPQAPEAIQEHAE